MDSFIHPPSLQIREVLKDIKRSLRYPMLDSYELHVRTTAEALRALAQFAAPKPSAGKPEVLTCVHVLLSSDLPFSSFR